MSNTMQQSDAGGSAAKRERGVGAGTIPCYSLFRRIHSLIRQDKFAVPVRWEFAAIITLTQQLR